MSRAGQRVLAWLLAGLAVCALGACEQPREPLLLVLLPPGSEQARPDVEQRGVLELMALRLRALRGIGVHVDPAGCELRGASHTLRIVRRHSEGSDITATELRDCADSRSYQETFIHPRNAPRDWSHAVAWWVALQLRRPAPRPRTGATLDERSMAAWLAALGHLQQRNGDSVGRARELLREVVRAQPEFADGHAELAITELLSTEYGLQPLEAGLERAAAAVDAALALDADNGIAHAARGLASMMRGQYRRAELQLLQAHRLEPGHDAIQLWLGNALLYGGQPRAAQPWLESAATINPGLVAARISLGEAHCLAGDEAACDAFLATPAASPMQSYVSALLRAHRGEHAAVHAALTRDPPAVDPDWVRGLREDCCLAAGLDECMPAPLQPPARPLEADLWLLDLGLAGALPPARSDPALADELRAEIARLRAGNVQLAVLDAFDACLDAGRVDDPALARLLQCPSDAAPAL